MTPFGEEYPFVSRDPTNMGDSLAPVLPFLLIGLTPLKAMGLVDSAASVNVLPYSIGIQLGVVWTDNHPTMQLAGNLAACEAKGILLKARVGSFPTVELVFAWAKSDAVPLLLGQLNFFLEFDVCFYRSQGLFRVQPKQSGNHLP